MRSFPSDKLSNSPITIGYGESMTRAFSLIELSIVLVILGLLTGGILAGQSLIRAAELRSVTTAAQTYTTAVMTFRDKYFAVPGDMANATSFWGIAGGTTGNDTTCRETISTDQKTCNGNGTGEIGTVTSSYEQFRFWQHLANAGLIEGQWPGAPYTLTPGVTIPAARIGNGAAWYPIQQNPVSGSANAFDGSYGTILNLFSRPTIMGVLSPEEAWNIDTKLDDGKPGRGKTLANWSATYSSTATPCTTASSGSDVTADYNLASKSKDCGFYFVEMF